MNAHAPGARNQSTIEENLHIASRFDLTGLPAMVAHVRKDLRTLDAELRELPSAFALRSVTAKCQADVRGAEYDADPRAD
ncbi:unnamed protein product, partial [Amoebophrya sp. A25]